MIVQLSNDSCESVSRAEFKENCVRQKKKLLTMGDFEVITIESSASSQVDDKKKFQAKKSIKKESSLGMSNEKSTCLRDRRMMTGGTKQDEQAG